MIFEYDEENDTIEAKNEDVMYDLEKAVKKEGPSTESDAKLIQVKNKVLEKVKLQTKIRRERKLSTGSVSSKGSGRGVVRLRSQDDSNNDVKSSRLTTS